MQDSFHIKLQQYFEDLLTDKTRALLIPQTQEKTVKKRQHYLCKVQAT